MPEGPEIAREADRIREVLQGETITRARFAFPRLTRRAGEVAGHRVHEVRARGKALLIRLEDGPTIYSHNQLYGRWYVREAGKPPRTNRSLRMALETDTHWALLYSASEIELLDGRGVETHSYLAKLGPDALDEALDAATLRERLADRRFARRQLGALLLDQGFVAGIGNYLRTEICFEARVHPSRRPGDLSATERRRLARAILAITRRAYASGGATMPARQVTARRRDGERWRTARHFAFVRSGRPCRRCTTKIERFDLASRRIYVCPACQPRPESLSRTTP